ncbi:MAG: DUF1800 family protein [Planctomycetes bacterium]|nr:DUF1800 family protein [Planctomycetota bacterium]
MSLSLRLGAGLVACAAPLATLAAQPAPNPDLELAHHVLRRVTFGPTPDLVARIANPPVGMSALQEAQAYIAEQLNPNAGADPFFPFGSADVQALDGPGGALGIPNTLPATTAQIDQFEFRQVVGSQLAHGLESKWQLREVMCQFWERHFNTHLVGSQFWFQNKIPATSSNAAHAWHYEWRANEFYRENALGTFHDLLVFTAQHVTMVAYLHLDRNTVAGPNEDFARELLELYTMSPELPVPMGTPVQNYSQPDVETVARILTGWSINPAADFSFTFNAANHDIGPKPAMFTPAYSLPVGTTGVNEGLTLLAELAKRDATKDFICRKLLNEFLVDGGGDLEPVLLGRMKNAWGNQGDITLVLTELLNSLEFLGTTYRFERARLPIEAVLAPPRAFAAGFESICTPAQPSFFNLINSWISMGDLGQSLQGYPAPNGYPSASAAQHSPHAAIARFSFAARSLFPTQLPTFQCPALTQDSLEYDVAGHIAATLTVGWNNPQLAARFLLETLYGTRFTAPDENAVVQAMGNAAVWWLVNNGTLDLSAPTTPAYRHVVNCGAVTAMAMAQGAIR